MLDIHEFFLEGGKRSRSHVLLHITEPTTPPEFVKGYFFVLIELHGAKTTHIQFIQELIDDIEAQYYSDEDASFEEILEATNRRTRQLVTGVKKIDCVVGVIQKKRIQFSYHGAPYVFLFHKKKDGTHQSAAILDGSEPEEMQEQLFSTMLQGSIGDSDVFFVGTPSIVDGCSLKQITKQLDIRSPKDTASYLEQTLQALQSGFSYGGVFFQRPQEEQISEPPIQTSRGTSVAKSAMPQLNTNTRMSQRVPTIQQSKTTMSESESNYRPRKNVAENKELTIVQLMLVALGKGLVGVSLLLLRMIKAVGIRIGRIIVGIIVIVSNHGNNRHTALQATKQWFFDKQLSFTSLPLLSKLLFFITLIFAILFGGSIWYLRVEEEQAQVVKEYTDTISAAVNKQDAADAAIIYGDDEKALTLLDEAKALIALLPTDTDTQIDKKGELTAKIEMSLQKLQKFTTITPESLAILPSDATVHDLAMLDDSLIAFGQEGTTAYVINKLTGTSSELSHETISSLRLATTPKENDAITFIYDDARLATYTTQTNAITTAEIGFPDTDPRIGAISIYNQRLYSVNTRANTIIRHGKTASGFDKGTPWLQDSADLSQARSIAIDGDMYVLTDSTVLKFSAGTQQNFSVSGLIPRLENPTVLWTYNDVNYIYILEPTNKRVIVLTKEGKLVNQYTSINWNNPTGMIVDDERGEIYVLDGNIVYSFTIK
ncbi:MAG: hypothetical protein GW939_03025 [Candidatus Magasanikbacteria bacterium]|nr:hypothetical protein [Candidatus Magasanikbacteria bacterium]NCS71706.1 hypothetical protein [Candidatus Magasanikbacteria bacterium]